MDDLPEGPGMADDEIGEKEVAVKMYYVDHETWIIEADSPEEAEKKALARVKSGEIPQICNTAICDDETEQPR